jgi:hypothetical protein
LQQPEGIEIDEKLNDRLGMAKDYRNIGVVYDNQGNYDHALQNHNKSL